MKTIIKGIAIASAIAVSFITGVGYGVIWTVEDRKEKENDVNTVDESETQNFARTTYRNDEVKLKDFEWLF